MVMTDLSFTLGLPFAFQVTLMVLLKRNSLNIFSTEAVLLRRHLSILVWSDNLQKNLFLLKAIPESTWSCNFWPALWNYSYFIISSGVKSCLILISFWCKRILSDEYITSLTPYYVVIHLDAAHTFLIKSMIRSFRYFLTIEIF